MFRVPAAAVAFLGLAALPLGLAGCGAAPQKSAASAPRGIFTSANDCSENGQLKIELCSKAIDAAIAEHEASAPSYTTLKACETAEGADRCERAASGRYRPRLLAFLVTGSAPPVGRPLYATLKGEPGFRTGERKNLLASDETLRFSEHAVTAYEAHQPSGKRKGMF